MSQSNGNGGHSTSDTSSSQVVDSFRRAVIDRFQMNVDVQECSYQEYLARPEGKRSGDEANAVDMRFARYTLEWLGFKDSDWIYNEPQAGQKANRPDYTIKGSIGTAFIWEDKNSTLDLSEEHITQMRRYSIGTAGYAVWCNMRRLLAVHFSPSDALRYEILTDVSVDLLFGVQAPFPDIWKAQATNLALFQLLFSKGRFTLFEQLVAKVGINEEAFEQSATSLDEPRATQNFIAGSRESLNHLRLAALAQIREALDRHDRSVKEEVTLQQEWEEARDNFIRSAAFTVKDLDTLLFDTIERLTARLGELEPQEIRNVGGVFEQGIGRMSVSSRTQLEKWLERALSINSALKRMRFEASNPARIAEAYSIWSERQSDKEDVKPEIFAEQVAYVFFVRLLLVRVLEDKHILQPRLASDGGFLDWSNYVKRHFKELEGIGILNENYYNILSRKAGHYYLHFYQQTIFDWFNPDDFLLVETLEFLCRYNFQKVTSDIIGYTYEEYIERNARNRKGHFLTRPDAVDYMLDLLDYTGPQVIGRRILDPACGSGSFLVHAARRYRQALVTYFCNVNGLTTEEEIRANDELRKDLARRYLDELTTLFYGMELNPFACYLAEMNLLIQGLDDLFVLQQAGDLRPVERFRIYNTDSLDLPREVLDSIDVIGTTKEVLVPDRFSDRLTDEAHPIKARLDDYAGGFSYVISNPPYVSSKQEELDTVRFRNAEFYKSILSGDMNLYLLFLRLGLYYLAERGRMIYIIPLTIFGDKSARAARKLLKTPPFSPSVAVRFYRGDILFPGVDQAVGIIRVNHSPSDSSIRVSGGNTIHEARAGEFAVPSVDVTEAVPQNHIWQGNWLVAQSQQSWAIWRHVKQVSSNMTTSMEGLLDTVFDRKQGDINATIVNPLRVRTRKGSFSNGDIAIYKGEDIRAFAPLPNLPSDWANPLQTDNKKQLSREELRISQVLEQLKHISGSESGIALREVARLNTRERLIATWFERNSGTPITFTHELWRMILKKGAKEEYGKALLTLINSKTIAYLINLFSTNNHVSKDELDRLPIPDPRTLPVTQLADLANQLLDERASLEKDFVIKYGARLPEFDDGKVYVPPAMVLADSRLPKLTIMDLVGRGEVKNIGPVNGRIRSLKARNFVVCTIPSTSSNAAIVSQVLNLFLSNPEREDDTWSQAQSWQLPDPEVAGLWLSSYNAISQQAQAKWDRFVALQRQADSVVADWYGFDDAMRAAIAEGLPWARRRRSNQTPIASAIATTAVSSQPADVIVRETTRVPVASSQVYAIGYDAATRTLEVEIPNKDVWQYQDVPLEAYQKFEAASSKGTYYSQEIKGQYIGKKL